MTPTPLSVIDSVPAPTADVVAKLEEMLASAREGEISAVAIAVVYRDGTTGGAWSKPYRTGALIGAVSILAARLTKMIVG